MIINTCFIAWLDVSFDILVFTYCVMYTAVQRQKAVSAYFTSKQILYFATLQVNRYCLLPLQSSIFVNVASIDYLHQISVPIKWLFCSLQRVYNEWTKYRIN